MYEVGMVVRSSPEQPHPGQNPPQGMLGGKVGCFSHWSDVIYCFFCFRTILKFVPTICTLSSSQDQLSLVHGAPIKEGTRIRLIPTCRIQDLQLVLGAATYTWAIDFRGCL